MVHHLWRCKLRQTFMAPKKLLVLGVSHSCPVSLRKCQLRPHNISMPVQSSKCSQGLSLFCHLVRFILHVQEMSRPALPFHLHCTLSAKSLDALAFVHPSTLVSVDCEIDFGLDLLLVPRDSSLPLRYSSSSPLSCSGHKFHHRFPFVQSPGVDET